MERLIATIGIAGAAYLAKRYLRKKEKEKEKEKKEKEEKKREEKREERPRITAETPIQRIKKYVYTVKKLRQKVNGPMYVENYHPAFRDPELNDLEKWAQFIIKYNHILSGPGSGSPLSLLINTAPLNIILTRDGRLFHLPEGETHLDVLINTWKPLFTYLDSLIGKYTSQGHPIEEAKRLALKEAGLWSKTLTPGGHSGHFALEYAFFSKRVPLEERKKILETLKTIYMDKLGLDWMPIPLTPTYMHYREGEGLSELKHSNQHYLQALPHILKQLGHNPEDETIQARLKALNVLLNTPSHLTKEIRYRLALIEALHREKEIDDQTYLALIKALPEKGPTGFLEATQPLVEKIKPAEEEAKPIAKAIAETLPPIAVKTALDYEKTPLYTGGILQKTLHPSLIKYYLTRTNPAHPQGTLLYPVITKTLAEWEKNPQNPPHPADLIEQILERETGKKQPEQLTPQETIKAALALGIPTTATPPTIKQALTELHRALKQLKAGKNPAQLDAEQEAALRHLQLKLLAENTPPDTEKAEQLLQNLEQAIQQAYRAIKQQALKEVQAGKEQLQEALEKLEKHLPTALKQYTKALTTKPISQAVAETTQTLAEKLRQEIPDPLLRSWTVNLAKNLLLDAPILAAAQATGTLKEKQAIAAALAQLYEKEAKEHHTTPMAADLHRMWQEITKTPPENRQETIQALKIQVKSLKDFMNTLRQGIEGILAEPIYTEQGHFKQEAIEHFRKTIQRTLEETTPTIPLKRKTGKH